MRKLSVRGSRVAVLAAFTMLVVACGSGSSASKPGGARPETLRPPTRADLERIADSVRRATNAPGAIVGVQIADGAPVVVARGTQDRAGTPLRSNDPFLTASVSKAFTAATVLALVRDGKLTLADSVVQYVPGWDPRITVRMLLDHSSGLRSWGDKDDPDTAHADLVAADLNRRFTPAEAIEPVRTAPLLAAPGTRTHYSNANTILLGEVVTAVTGSSIGMAMDRYVVQPLRLRSTGYAPEGLEPRPKISGALYIDDAQTTEIETAQYPMTSLLTLSGPAIAVVSDAPDLFSFGDAFLRGEFPSKHLVTQARRIAPGGSGLGIIGFTPAGYCIFDGCPARSTFPRIGFAGNVDGGAVRVVYDSKLDVMVLVFANSNERGKLDSFVVRTFGALRR